MRKRRLPAFLVLPAAYCIVAGSVGFSADHQKATALLREHARAITSAAAMFSIDARLLASVVYAERSLNWRTAEDVVDIVLARLGYNSSVGVAQVKVETAAWINQQLNDRTSAGYLGPRIETIFHMRMSRIDLIDALEDPAKNLLFAAAYIAIIEKSWASGLRRTTSRPKGVGIIATLYSIGLTRAGGSFRNPHADAHTNEFGAAAETFYDSFDLRDLYPGEGGQ